MHTPQTDLMAHKITAKVARYTADSQRHTTYRAGEVEGWKAAWEFLTDTSATDENLDEAAGRHRARSGDSA